MNQKAKSNPACDLRPAIKAGRCPIVRPIARPAALAAFFVVGACLTLFAAVPAVRAATAPYAAKEMIRSAQKLEMAPGESRTFTIGLKNVGAKTWRAEGKNFVSIYTFEPKYRESAFADHAWMSETQPARLLDAEVKPGAIGRVSFTLYAPLEPKLYKETFALAAESLAWIPGGKFTVEINVTEDAVEPAFAPGNGFTPERKLAAGYKAMKMLVSDQKLSLKAGETKDFRVAFKNIGRKAWSQAGAAPLVLRAEQGNTWTFRHSTWTNDIVTRLKEAELQPGGLSFFNISLTAPSGLSGLYNARFTLNVGDEEVEGGEVEIPIEVQAGQVPASFPTDTLYDPDLSGFGARGPNIRVGLYYTTNPTIVLAAAGSYALIDGDDQLVTKLSGVTTVVFNFSDLTYRVSNGSYVFNAAKHVHFRPDDPAATIFEIQSLENRPSWDPNVNFNKFRGTIEVFYTRATSRLWVMEELPVEDYLRGLAETSNGSPLEYQKALVTAARTYALYVKAMGGKHQSEYFDLNTTGTDQVYKGYASELVRPNVVRAVEDTRGMIVSYNNEIVVTPYFSRSDGRTRAWTEVWGSKAHPWLVSVPCPYDAGKTLYGHGVGMSAQDAAYRADAGAAWDQILKYYYTGIELKRLY